MANEDISIIRKKTLDQLLEGYTPKKVEEEGEIMTDSEEYRPLLKKYEKIMEAPSDPSKSFVRDENEITEILNPEQIPLFLLHTLRYQDRKNYPLNTAIFLSRLIQNSYQAGYNDFCFESLPDIGGMCSYLLGSKNNPIRIRFKGDIGLFYGAKSEYIEMDIEGNASMNCGHCIKNSRVTIQGSVYQRCGFMAEESVFEIFGTTDKNCALGSGDSAFIFHNKVDEGCAGQVEGLTLTFHGPLVPPLGMWTKKSTYKTTSLATKKVLLESGVDTYEENKIVFIHSDGREEVVRKYGDKLWK